MQGGRLAVTDRSAIVPTGTAQPHYALPISKLRGVPLQLRVALKVRRITTCDQLLAAAGRFEDREALARAARLAPELLCELVQLADMARVSGIGAVFGLMLEELGIEDVEGLATRDPGQLHQQLREYNQRERLARRSPTPEEVADWVEQARRLPVLVTYRTPSERATGT
jgi:nucleotidyltransferase/DNA polymerase involved in DNA repair